MKSAKVYVSGEDVTNMSKVALLTVLMHEKIQQKVKQRGISTLLVKSKESLPDGTLQKVEHYLNKALASISDDEIAPDYNLALSAMQNNPLLCHTHWSTQLQLTASNNQSVMDYYDFVDAATVAKNLYPHWTVKQPEAAIAKQAQRKTLLSISTDSGKLYPLQQFDLTARSPSMLASLKGLLRATTKQKLTNMELLHWLCSPVMFTLSTSHSQQEALDEVLAQGDHESALQRIAQMGPSKTTSLIPIEIAQQENRVLFEQMLSNWLSQKPVKQALTSTQREEAIEHLKAQMAALDISDISLTDAA